jgi:hypothetical protein
MAPATAIAAPSQASGVEVEGDVEASIARLRAQLEPVSAHQNR